VYNVYIPLSAEYLMNQADQTDFPFPLARYQEFVIIFEKRGRKFSFEDFSLYHETKSALYNEDLVKKKKENKMNNKSR